MGLKTRYYRNSQECQHNNPEEMAGRIVLPAMMASDGNGCISWNITDGNPDEIRLHIESYRVDNCISCGIVLGKHADPEQCQVIPAGTRKAAFELTVAAIKPNIGPGIAEPSAGLKRHWSTIFSCFRPEYRGFSNNSASVNCHQSQGPPIEIAVHTQIHPKGQNPIDLARFTIEKGILKMAEDMVSTVICTWIQIRSCSQPPERFIRLIQNKMVKAN